MSKFNTAVILGSVLVVLAAIVSTSQAKSLLAFETVNVEMDSLVEDAKTISFLGSILEQSSKQLIDDLAKYRSMMKIGEGAAEAADHSNTYSASSSPNSMNKRGHIW